MKNQQHHRMKTAEDLSTEAMLAAERAFVAWSRDSRRTPTRAAWLHALSEARSVMYDALIGSDTEADL